VNQTLELRDSYGWSERFNTGLAEIDQQHRKTAEHLSALAHLAEEDAPNAALLAEIRTLFEQTGKHFEFEENMMREYQLDADFLSAHQRAHISLIEQVRIVVSMIENSIAPSASAVCKLLPFLHKWMIFHVVGTDMRMARMIQALQRGASHEDALHQGLAQQTESLVVLLDTLNELYDDLSRRSTELQEAHHRLSLSEARYALAQRAARIGSWEYDLQTHELNWSHEVEALFGFAVGTLPTGYTSYIECVHPQDRALVDNAFNETLSNQSLYDIEHRIVRPDGTIRWIAATGDFIRNAEGAPERLVGVLRDTTEQKESQRRLLDTNQQLSLALNSLERHASDLTRLNSLNEGLQSSLTVQEAYEVLERTLGQLQLGSGGSLAVSTDCGKRMRTVASWGEGACMMTNFNTHDCWAMRRSQRHAVYSPAVGLMCKHFDLAPQGPVLCQPLQVLGETLGLLTIKAPPSLSDPDWARVNHLTSMVSESLKLALSNIRLREALHEQAIRDPLTRLLNRRYLTETLPRELHRAEREHRKLSLVMLDLDHFKQVNDTWGHEAGDAVLQHIANMVRTHLRASDLACRFGGEEFVIVMLGADLAEAQERMTGIAARVRESRPHMGNMELPIITFSAGIAEAFIHGETAEKLLRAADHALYDAKEAGRDRVIAASVPKP